MNDKAEVLTLGCRLKAYESEVMQNHADSAGLTDVVIVNTCAVTAEATRQARQSIRKMKREHPDKKIIVTGCAAQVDPAQFAEMDEVSSVLGNQEKLEAKSFSNLSLDGEQKVSVNDIFDVITAAPFVSFLMGVVTAALCRWAKALIRSNALWRGAITRSC